MRELVKGEWLIRLYPASRSLTELKMRVGAAQSKGLQRKQIFLDNAERDRAIEQRAAQLISEGWMDRSKGSPKNERPAKGLESAFAAIATRTIAELRKAQTPAQDEAVWRRALDAYATLKVKTGGDPTENAVHFFSVDGIALEHRHPVVVAEVKATAARKARWLALLQAS